MAKLPYHALDKKGTLESLGVSKAFLEGQTGILFCPECRRILPSVERIDIRLEEDVLRKRTWLNLTFNGGVGLIREEMIDMIGWELAEKHLWLGTVWKPDGSTQANWRTFRGKYRQLIRGKGGTSNTQCSNCGQRGYTQYARKQFLFPPPPPDVPIIDGRSGQLILRQDIFERLDLKRIRNVWIQEVGVTDISPDGLPPFEIV